MKLPYKQFRDVTVFLPVVVFGVDSIWVQGMIGLWLLELFLELVVEVVNPQSDK